MQRVKFMSILGLCLIGFVAACGSTVNYSTTGSVATTPTAAPTATATLAMFITNPTVAPGACPTETATDLSQIIPFPPNAIILDQAPSFADGVDHSFSFTSVIVCVPGSTPDTIRHYYISTMPQQGWVSSTTYPYNGNIRAACGDPYCWKKTSSGSILAVSLEDVRLVGSFVRYVIRFTSYN